MSAGNHCSVCHGWLALRGQESAGDQACDCPASLDTTGIDISQGEASRTAQLFVRTKTPRRGKR